MVVKDCVLPQPMYSVPRWWYDQLPRELALHRRIDRKRKRETSDVGFEHLVEHFGYRLMMRRRRYRLYLKYYAGRDMADLFYDTLDKWSPFGDVEAYQKLSSAKANSLPKVPEGLLWYLLQSLVKAYLVLNHGTTSDTVSDPEWKPITHLDLSYNNAFLQPGSDSMEATRIVLADLGMGFIERTTSSVADGEEPFPSDNPFEFVLNHPHTNHPVERQYATRDPPFRIGEKTDVWKLGGLIWELMTCGVDKDHVQRENGTRGGVLAKHPVTSGQCKSALGTHSMFPTPYQFYPSADTYSDDLKQLVRSCLHYNPTDRASFRELDRTIGKYIQDNPQVVRNALASMPTKIDRFAVGKRLRY